MVIENFQVIFPGNARLDTKNAVTISKKPKKVETFHRNFSAQNVPLTLLIAVLTAPTETFWLKFQNNQYFPKTDFFSVKMFLWTHRMLF